MTTALITGANKGIGLETARRLLGLGWTVWLGSRDPERGREALAQLDGDVRLLDIDITDDASVTAAAAAVAPTGLDVLVNNAAIASQQAGEVPDAAELGGVLAVNLLGTTRVLHAFVPLLHGSHDPRVVQVSSTLGSFALASDPATPAELFHYPTYAVSKAALNMLTVQLARTVDGIRFVAVEPGYTATDLNGHSGTQTPAEAAANVVAAATADLATGSFVGADGAIAW
ncbi:SDR family NAD(P)-dependent oxidoreductase [Nocardioides mangrovicus]|uniref:SDR family NAD(P)-dependent oxidoreductase n=1 Tax=Nocardioides mangrovicus TaxID=2478913 RepID=A0A3L8P4T4_9ACTN|nr:SDR family NAD(P)-dependent oxidoreductase [Nocardioides mangrovicus]RLV50181.1 SDR family NAD(P)-dependent oxidoreductase [Nocardioides mangrovicus]